MPINQSDQLDTSGGSIIAGEGTAGAPTGGVVTVQGSGLTGSQQPTADIIASSIISGAITVSTTAVAVRVGASNLTNRKMLIIVPTSGTVYIGATSGVTTSTGVPIFANQVATFSFAAGITPFVIAATSISVIIMEGA